MVNISKTRTLNQKDLINNILRGDTVSLSRAITLVESKRNSDRKLANILFTRELSRKVFEKGITVNCLHPGFVATNFGTQNDSFWGRLAMKIATPFARKSFQGASSSIYLCSSNEVEEISGEYFYDCKIGKLTSAASNDETAAKLWKLTEDLTGIKF